MSEREDDGDCDGVLLVLVGTNFFSIFCLLNFSSSTPPFCSFCSSYPSLSFYFSKVSRRMVTNNIPIWGIIQQMDWQRHLGESCTINMFIEQWDYTAVRTNLAAIKIHMRKITVNRMNLILGNWIRGRCCGIFYGTCDKHWGVVTTISLIE